MNIYRHNQNQLYITSFNRNSRNAVIYNVPLSYQPLLFMRKFSTYNNLQLQLSKDIRYVHENLKADNLIPSITPFHLSSIQEEIENSSYKVAPLECIPCLSSEIYDILKGILPDYPGVHVHVHKNSERIMIIKESNIKDHLVLVGLSVTLHRLIYGSLPQNGFRLLDRFPAFLQSLEDMNNVDKMYKIDLSASISVITKSQVIKALKPFIVGDNGYVFRLVCSLFELPIYTKDGVPVSVKTDIPPLGEVFRLLFNVVLMDIFDREFVKCHPKIRFRRFYHEVFVPVARVTPYDVFFSEKSCYDLLGKTGLRGKIYTIIRGEGYLTSGCNIKKIIYINNSSKVVITDTSSLLY